MSDQTQPNSVAQRGHVEMSLEDFMAFAAVASKLSSLMDGNTCQNALTDSGAATGSHAFLRERRDEGVRSTP